MIEYIFISYNQAMSSQNLFSAAIRTSSKQVIFPQGWVLGEWDCKLFSSSVSESQQMGNVSVLTVIELRSRMDHSENGDWVRI